MTTAQIFTDVADVLADEKHETYEEKDLIAWLNDAILALITVRPDATQVNRSFQLVPGTKQSIPATDLRLIRVVRNTGADGNTIGKAILEGDLETQDAINPDWHAATVATVILEYFKHRDEPKIFYVSPPVHGSTDVYVEASLAAIPALIIDSTTALPVDDIYQPALHEWMLYRCFARDDEDTPGYERSKQHKKGFFELLGIKQTVEKSQRQKEPVHAG